MTDFSVIKRELGHASTDSEKIDALYAAVRCLQEQIEELQRKQGIMDHKLSHGCY